MSKKIVFIPTHFFFMLLFSIGNCQERSISEDSPPIPGRLGSELSCAEFGNTRLFFYMTPEKHKLGKDFIPIVRDEMLHTIVKAELDFPIVEVTPVCTEKTDPIGYDTTGAPIYVDQRGTLLFNQHAQQVKEIAEKALDIHINGLSKQMSLILNFDANKFHQDQFVTQYEFLNKHPLPIPRYILIQDLTLIDWEMAKGTFSATMVQDPESSDRFIFPLFPKEVTCTFYTEPAIYLGPDKAPEYPGARTLPPHSPIACIDGLGNYTSGSSKGKRVSVAVRGVVKQEEIDNLQKRSKKLPINRYSLSTTAGNTIVHKYPNGITLREIRDNKSLRINANHIFRYPDQENVEIYETQSKDNKDAIVTLQKTFGFTSPVEAVKVRHLVKKDGGFSKFSSLNLPIEKGDRVVLVNRSLVPDGYEHYNIAQDFTTKGQPWIQLYDFPLTMAMCLTPENLQDLSLTPVEEIIFRNARQDIECTDPNNLHDKIVTQVDVFIFPR